MSNKVIIDLDEYLKLRDAVGETVRLNAIAEIHEEDGLLVDPLGPPKNHTIRNIVISRKNLEEYINNVLGLKGYNLKIREDQ